ncbi:MAG TPA: type II secretion system protein GspM [Methylocella sp.]|nr:type II secretion system protein GspM [Methylocella sp.]
MIGLLPRIEQFRWQLNRARAAELLAYILVTAVFFLISWLALSSLAGDYEDYASAAEMLARLESRNPAGAASGTGARLQGSPFIEGPTLTIAGAALQRRVADAIEKAGGNLLSSQVDFQGPHERPGYVGLSVSCEIEQNGLQQLLYDLETGMPFLFIEQLVVQVPQSAGLIGAETGPARMRLQIDVSGQWQGAK